MFLIGGEKKKGWESAVNLTTAKLILDELSTKEQSRAALPKTSDWEKTNTR